MDERVGVPLAILVVDGNRVAAESLVTSANRDPRVIRAEISNSVDDARARLHAGGFNAVFVDPLTLGVDEASRFVFWVRTAWPEIVFVLYMDLAAADRTSDFYSGERRRFQKYYKLDKQTSVAAFEDEVVAVLGLCASDLSWRMSRQSLTRLEAIVDEVSEHSALDPDRIARLRADVDAIATQIHPERSSGRSVFVSHRFAEKEYVEGLTLFLIDAGFDIVIGAPTNTYVSQAILQRIADADYFLCILTRHGEKTDGSYSTSAWLLEEKGAALALGKRIVLMIEDGVKDYGGLQGDWQRIHFTPKGFAKAAHLAVEQLKSFID